MTLDSVSILTVWERLGGGELRHGRGRAFWRAGDGHNVAVDEGRGCWFDFVAGRGGGALALVQTVLQCDKPAALAWLEREGFIEPRQPLTVEERRAFAIRREGRRTAAQEIAWWRDALVAELEVPKESLFAPNVSTKQRLRAARAARDAYYFGSLDAAGVARMFFAHRAADPAAVARLVEAGRARDMESRSCAAAVVALMAGAAGSEMTNAA